MFPFPSDAPVNAKHTKMKKSIPKTSDKFNRETKTARFVARGNK